MNDAKGWYNPPQGGGGLSPNLPNGYIFVGSSGGLAIGVPMSQDGTIDNLGELTLSTVNGNVGSFTNANITVDAKGRITAVSNGSGGSTSITIGTTPIINGSVGNIVFHGSGDVIQESANLFWDNAGNKLVISSPNTDNSIVSKWVNGNIDTTLEIRANGIINTLSSSNVPFTINSSHASNALFTINQGGGSMQLFYQSSGNYGVGIYSSNGKVNIQAAELIVPSGNITVNGANIKINPASGLVLFLKSTASSNTVFQMDSQDGSKNIQFFLNNAGTNFSTSTDGYKFNNAADTPKVFIGVNGTYADKTGFGTLTPSERVDVNGNINTTGYKINNNAGVDFSGIATNITVEKGIITAIS